MFAGYKCLTRHYYVSLIIAKFLDTVKYITCTFRFWHYRCCLHNQWQVILLKSRIYKLITNNFFCCRFKWKMLIHIRFWLANFSKMQKTMFMAITWHDDEWKGTYVHGYIQSRPSRSSLPGYSCWRILFHFHYIYFLFFIYNMSYSEEISIQLYS